MKLTFALLFLALALLGVVLRKNYYAVPVRELKRRAAQHDLMATQLYRAVAYGNSLRSLLWLYIGLTSAASLILLARLLPVWLSLLVIGPLLWIVFSLLPASRTTRLGNYLTRLATPPIAWLLNYLHPVLSRAADAVEDHYVAAQHTGLFERDDLLALIKQQGGQADNRLSAEELKIASRALSFGDHKVADVLTPRKAIKTILASDTIGPVLIDELHKSGQDYALVRASAKGDVVGSLRFENLNLESHGHVSDIMNPTVYYLHENDSLDEALHAFFVTNQPVFVVVNEFEEYLGIISVETILRQLLGHVPGEDFDQYTDLNAVAARHTKTPVKTDDKVVE